MSEILIQALQNPALYPHPVTTFEVIQTHLSWVILTGDYAYKIKKPLNLGFQDFTTLEKRKYYCELEIILNKRLAPQIYIEALAITGSAAHPKFNDKEEAFEYAIKMHQFPQQALLGELAKKSKLTKRNIEDIAEQIAKFHLEAPICSMHRLWGRPEEVFAPIQDNFNALNELKVAKPYIDTLSHIEKWAKNQYKKLQPFLMQRKTGEFIRACHGDLHLGNIVMIKNKPVIFDCIEFNESFRWTDVMNDVSFLAMDLEHHHLNDLSHLFVNHYLEHTGDYGGAILLKFYQCYRSMVRAKICALQLMQLNETDPLVASLQEDLKELLSLAKRYTQNRVPTLTITFGVSGSGKTTHTEQLLMQQDAIRLRSDVIRKQMHGISPYSLITDEQKEKIYSSQATQSLYHKLQMLAQILLQNELDVIIDATCIKQWQRQLFIELAAQLNVSLKILAFDISKDILQQRIAQRTALKQDPSDADNAVLELQLSSIEPLTEEEKQFMELIRG